MYVFIQVFLCKNHITFMFPFHNSDQNYIVLIKSYYKTLFAGIMLCLYRE